MFTAIMKTTSDGRVAKYQDFPTKVDADAHVEIVKPRYPDAFVIPTRAENNADWKVDMRAKTVSIEMRPPAPPQPEPVDLPAEITNLKARMAVLENRRQ